MNLSVLVFSRITMEYVFAPQEVNSTPFSSGPVIIPVATNSELFVFTSSCAEYLLLKSAMPIFFTRVFSASLMKWSLAHSHKRINVRVRHAGSYRSRDVSVRQ